MLGLTAGMDGAWEGDPSEEEREGLDLTLPSFCLPVALHAGAHFWGEKEGLSCC